MSSPRTTIELDDRPMPVIAYELICPHCNYLLRRVFLGRGFGYRHEHGPEPSDCPNANGEFRLDFEGKVHRVKG